MSNKKTAPSYAKYVATGAYAKNKAAKLQRHLKKHPEDSQAKDAIKNIKSYSRKKPENKLGWVKDTLKASLSFIPQYTTKGNLIIVRKDATNVDSLFSKFGQSATITKDYITSLAQYVKRSNTIMFQPTLVVENEKLVWKHVAEKSNFKGEVEEAPKSS